MTSELGSVPPPSGAEQPCITVAFIHTSLVTRLALDVLPTDSVSDLKTKMTACHLTTFPSHGEIVVHSLKFKHRRQLYCLSDSMLMSCFVNRRGRDLLLFAEVSATEEHLQRPAPLIHGQASAGGAMSSLSMKGIDNEETGVEELPKNVFVSPQTVDVDNKSLPKKRRKCAPRKDSTKKQQLEGTKHVSKAPYSLPEVEDPIDKEKIIGDTAMIMDGEFLDADIGSRTEAQKGFTIQNDAIDGAKTEDVSRDQMATGDSKNATREDAIKDGNLTL
ncbi:hypothetical protein MLD38_037837 [Melastoma candidum]|uniref:Uncharacterized protein n=1 Tax=Melastoma candidum TaxID=119954 RepID=A0ACB9LNW1_9MYRT|nr:hypothetical protein MLD38_037837 [Melastoma candidum]